MVEIDGPSVIFLASFTVSCWLMGGKSAIDMLDCLMAVLKIRNSIIQKIVKMKISSML